MMSSPAATPSTSGRNTPHLTSPVSRMRLKDETVEDIVNNAKIVLETSKDFLELAPVPGLSAAVGTVIAILEQVQKTKANKKTVKAFCGRTLELKNTLERFKTRLEEKINKSEQGIQDEVRASMERSDDLKERIAQLAEKVEENCRLVSGVGKGNRLERFFSASRDEDSLKEAEAGLARSMHDFQIIGGVTIEMLVDSVVTTVQEIRREQEAAALREQEIIERQKEEAKQRQEEEEAKTLKELLASETELSQATDRPRNAYAKDTRAEVFKRLDTWRQDENSIFYLSGALGRGKSVIASEFCHRYHSDVGAYFFFKRGNGTASSVERLVPVIAYQLAEACRELRPHIVVAAQEYVKRRKSLPIDELVQTLLSAPFSAAAPSVDPSTQLYIVIDAVDECTDSESLSSSFLAHFLPCIHATRFLRLLITSRPSPSYIGKAICQHSASACDTMSLDTEVNRQEVDADILVAIDNILRTSPTSGAWHSKRRDVIDTLLENSEGLFVYACTAARFLSNVEEYDVDASLKALLSKERPYGLDNLDALYVNVLTSAFPTATTIPEISEAVHIILGFVALGNGEMWPEALAQLMAIPCQRSISILQKLRSVIQYDPPEPRERFTPIHVTFGDFLLRSPTRSPNGVHVPYHIDPATFHARLALACVKDVDIEYIHTSYAGEHWFFHIIAALKARGRVSDSQAEDDEAGDFLKKVATLFETIVPSLETDDPSYFCRSYDTGLPDNSPEEIATFLRWIDLNTNHDIAIVFAKWIEMARSQYQIQIQDTIVVTMRGHTSEDYKIKDELYWQFSSQKNDITRKWRRIAYGL